MELTLLIVLPLLGALVVALLPKARTELVFPVALGVSVLPLGASLWIMVNFVSGDPLFQFNEDYVLSETFGIAWRLGDKDTPDELLTRSDKALYAAKRGGRNRVEKQSEPSADAEHAANG